MTHDVHYEHLFGTNYVPFGKERAKIRRIVDAQKEAVMNLDANIATARAVLNNLLTQRHTLERRREAHEELLSPARRILPEILAEVFLCCIEQQMADGPFDFPFPSPADAPLVLGRVCHDWRQVALSTPRLWASLSIPNNPKCIPEIRAWISRSGSCPLNFSLRITGSSALPFCESVSAVLLPHARRWRAVDLGIPEQCTKLFVPALCGSLPLLERLSVKRFNISADMGIAIDPAPRLTHLLLQNVGLLSSPADLTTQGLSPHLRSIVLAPGSRTPAAATATLDDALALLRHCPHLEDFHFVADAPGSALGGAAHSGSTATLPRLVRFRVDTTVANRRGDGRPSADPGPLLDRLCLPALRELVLNTHGMGPGAGWAHLGALLERSRAPLETLFVAGMTRMDEVDLLSCLRHAPRVRSVSVDSVDVTDATMEALTPGGAAGPVGYVCPELRSLKLRRREGHMLSCEAIAGMIVARRKGLPAVRLERLFLFDRSLVDVYAYPGVAACVADGLCMYPL